MKNEKVLVPLAEGFEETEAVAIIDVLRRAGLEVVTASLAEKDVCGAHGIVIQADRIWDELDLASLTAVVLPGGMPGTTKLQEDERVLELVRRLAGEKRLTAAVCAAPLVLASAGVLTAETEITCYPSFLESLAEYSPSADSRVVRSGSIITSQGPGTSLEFALAVVEHLVGADEAAEVAAGMLVRTGG
ncbi:MAG: 4-methyl-5(b-hydroxyethyl)-thiazole monophosphate biosynthesis [Planctomycetota bacterium]|jgi:4-methyl-5(b-hydroxyethyl)-thiazole monophosphate biosynthesis